MRGALNDTQRLDVLVGDNGGNTALQDARLLPGNILQRRAEKLGVVDRDRRNDRRRNVGDDVRSIKPTAEPNFQQERVGRMPREDQKGGRCGNFEEGDRIAGIQTLAFGKSIGEFIVADVHAATFCRDPDAFVEPHEIGRRVDVDPEAGRLENRAEKSDRGALPVRPGHVDRGRLFSFRATETREQPLDAAEGKIDLLRMELGKTRDQCFGPLGSARRFGAHAGLTGTGTSGSGTRSMVRAGNLVSSRHKRASVARIS